ncbi:putative ORFan [Tupanvirus deep ocean]|uniref:ORFan n=2 Tax=Tupanvirus TaxID=2094720 RepID=A0AC62A8C5_9VIRU|nr:putative ORFan [Tupanvirus deep ocean]QKU33999.1 putative ORFan [Tupanvirus deep ocean]
MKIITGLLVILLLFCLFNFYLYYRETKNRCLWQLNELSPNITVTHYILFTKNTTNNQKIDASQVKPANNKNQINDDFYKYVQNFMANENVSSNAILLSNYQSPINLTEEDIRKINGRLSF